MVIEWIQGYTAIPRYGLTLSELRTAVEDGHIEYSPMPGARFFESGFVRVSSVLAYLEYRANRTPEGLLTAEDYAIIAQRRERFEKNKREKTPRKLGEKKKSGK